MSSPISTYVLVPLTSLRPLPCHRNHYKPHLFTSSSNHSLALTPIYSLLSPLSLTPKLPNWYINFNVLCAMLFSLINSFPHSRGFPLTKNIINFSFHWWWFSIDLFLEHPMLWCQDSSYSDPCSASKTLISSSLSYPLQFPNHTLILENKYHSSYTICPNYLSCIFSITSTTYWFLYWRHW